jgi:hypothetical protein
LGERYKKGRLALWCIQEQIRDTHNYCSFRVTDLNSTWIGDANLDGEFNAPTSSKYSKLGNTKQARSLAGLKAIGAATRFSIPVTSSPRFKTAATKWELDRPSPPCRNHRV